MSLTFKRHYRLLFIFALFTGSLALVIGDERIIAYATSPTSQGAAFTSTSRIAESNTFSIKNEIALLDESLVHAIQVLISDEAYNQMLTTYKQTGQKEYVQADVIIDGVRINDVGIRLKGNATLRAAIGGGQPGFGRQGEAGGQRMGIHPPMEGAPGNRGQQPFVNAPRNQAPGDENLPVPPIGFEPGQAQGGLQPGFAPQGMDLDDGDHLIPYMLKFDKFVLGQTYQGYSLLAIRTAGVRSDASLLPEPVTNAMARLVGIPATDTAYTSFQINDEPEKLYVISEVIDTNYLAKYFPGTTGVLYKAELGSSLQYMGENPSAYAQSFTQQTRVNDADLGPLIAFMRFLEEADETRFEAELDDYLDTGSFAAYLALNNLLVNIDSIAGMNNNYYLYYNEIDGRFYILMWDANESLGGLSQGTQTANYDIYYASSQDGFPRPFGTGGPGGGQNTLTQRFLANETFKAYYKNKLELLYQEIFVSGAIFAQINTYSALVQETSTEPGLITAQEYQAAVTSVQSFIQERIAYLANTPLLKD